MLGGTDRLIADIRKVSEEIRKASRAIRALADFAEKGERNKQQLEGMAKGMGLHPRVTALAHVLRQLAHKLDGIAERVDGITSRLGDDPTEPAVKIPIIDE